MCGRRVFKCVIGLASAAMLMGAKCPGIPSTHDINLTVVTSEIIEMSFQARGSINVEAGVEIIDVGTLRHQIEDAGINVDLVKDIKVSAVEYGVTAYNEAETDRAIVGAQVTVKKSEGGPTAVLIDDLNAEVYPLLGRLVPAPIDKSGVDFINDLLSDVLAALKSGGSSSFQVIGAVNGVSQPVGRTTDFDWRVRIYYQISGGFPTESPDF